MCELVVLLIGRDRLFGFIFRTIVVRRVCASFRSICVAGGNNFCRFTAPIPNSPYVAQMFSK